MEELNFEDLEKEIDEKDLESFERDLNAKSSLERVGLEDAKETLCKFYSKIRPTLKKIPKIPFVPKKVKRAIEGICKGLDLLCGIS